MCIIVRTGIAAPSLTDQAAQTLLNQLLQALQLPDEQQSIRALLPLVHASLLTPDGTSVNANVRQFSLRKARQDAHLYEVPARIVRTRVYDQTSVDLGNGREAGRLVDYFIHKSAGLPAPVKVFFPAHGQPVVTYLGNL